MSDGYVEAAVEDPMPEGYIDIANIGLMPSVM